jgi:hypothetical protein
MAQLAGSQNSDQPEDRFQGKEMSVTNLIAGCGVPAPELDRQNSIFSIPAPH